MSREKTEVKAWFCWLFGFVGLCGLHRFYLGKNASGWFYLLTFGVFGIGQILDAFVMESMVLDANTRPYLPRETVTTKWSSRRSSRQKLSQASSRPVVIAVTNIFHEATGKIVTRVKCGYCGNVYPDNVRSCAGCGAHLAA